ncbi:unnamed protein product, partial [Owenia fusiformis]
MKPFTRAVFLTVTLAILWEVTESVITQYPTNETNITIATTVGPTTYEVVTDGITTEESDIIETDAPTTETDDITTESVIIETDEPTTETDDITTESVIIETDEPTTETDDITTESVIIET